jgi:hypothetical protein
VGVWNLRLSRGVRLSQIAFGLKIAERSLVDTTLRKRKHRSARTGKFYFSSVSLWESGDDRPQKSALRDLLTQLDRTFLGAAEFDMHVSLDCGRSESGRSHWCLQRQMRVAVRDPHFEEQ